LIRKDDLNEYITYASRLSKGIGGRSIKPTVFKDLALQGHDLDILLPSKSVVVLKVI